ncbi:hypothetical protein BKA63DRAFT_485128 [Paraphoma chrysanthemicola]|nr:hypothetical protein BKA63DRAFT_485128 [Paraphoma chrysanthemicola]
MSTESRRPSAAARGGSLVVQVGPEYVEYAVHKALLTEQSEYFKRALGGPWKEAEEGIVRLDDVDCSIFEIFVDWLYTNTLPEDESAWDDSGHERGSAKGTERTMIKVCALAHRLLAANFGRAVTYEVVCCFINENGDAPPYYDTIILAFEILPPMSPILQLLVDLHCLRYCSEDDSQDEIELQLRSRLPHEFLVRTMLRYSKLIKSSPTRVLEACDYHEHGSGEEREACQG